MGTQLCPTLCDPMDCYPPGSSVRWIFQARILAWVAISSSRGSSWVKDQNCISYVPCIGRSIVTLFSSITQSCPIPCDPMDCSMPSLPVCHQLPELAQTHVHEVSDAIQPSHSLLSPSPPAFKLSQYQGFSNESILHIRLPKYWSFSFHISPSNEYSGLISFRIDWLDLLAVQGTFKSLFQHHSPKTSILQGSASLKSNSHIHTELLEEP